MKFRLFFFLIGTTLSTKHNGQCGPKKGKVVTIDKENYCATDLGNHQAKLIVGKCKEISAEPPVPRSKAEELDIIAAMKVLGIKYIALGISDAKTEGLLNLFEIVPFDIYRRLD